MDIDIKEYLIDKIGEKRYEHSLRVVEVAKTLGEKYNVDLKKLETAALLHDCAKIKDKELLLKSARSFDIIKDDIMLENTELIHAYLGAEFARRDFGIEDEDILNSIRYHTTGRVGMTSFEKIIFLADYIEPVRNFPGVEIVRELAYENLDKAVLQAMNQTINFLIERGLLISIDTINARNSIILNN